MTKLALGGMFAWVLWGAIPAWSDNTPGTPVPKEGLPSPYRDFRDQLIKTWPPKMALIPGSNDISIAALTREDNPLYIGVDQSLRIAAPLARVEAVLDQFESYKDLFEGFQEIKVLGREENRILTAWEQIIPILFVSNVRYSMTYTLDKSNPNFKFYSYSLVKSDDLKSSDGLIGIEKIDDQNTSYREFDFWDAHWGIAKHFAPTKIWNDSVEGVVLSDLSVKIRAEHPEFSFAEVHRLAHLSFNQKMIEQAIKDRKPFRSEDYLGKNLVK